MNYPNKVLITGGAGFIGIHAARHFMKNGVSVVIVDDLSRPGSPVNLKWLKNQGDFKFYRTDITQPHKLNEVFKKNSTVDCVLHLAGQVAVTTSVVNPRRDFEVNAFGTFNVLEAARKLKSKPFFIFSSTNKVYGGLNFPLKTLASNYTYRSLPHGIDESYGIDFHSPYGCSKGAADQYVRDYFRIYRIPSVVFRQSCIYGTQQFGVEDQGWVAHFIISAVLNKPLTIYGDGKQVRDLLNVKDLVELYGLSFAQPKKAAGEIFNVGGGPSCVLSLLQLVKVLETKLGKKISFKKKGWRPGDQKVYISDIRKAKKELGWKPKIDPLTGINELIDWVQTNPGLFKTHKLKA